ncbi:MAG: hypothetical protein IJQ31_15155 [Thermoguttaceae bacterium]|nr:hypothetical protein [Thermoguttaceae bacterium]
MKFEKFEITQFLNAARGLYDAGLFTGIDQDMIDQCAEMFRICDLWKDARRPFYRLYPGYISIVEKLDFTKIPWKCSIPLSTIALELPETLDYIVEGLPGYSELHVRSMLVHCDAAREKMYAILYGFREGEEPTNSLLVDVLQTGEDGKYGLITKLVLGLQLVQDEPDLFKPVLLRRDDGKPATDALIQRAIRNGVFGFEVGEMLPTREEIEEMRKDGEYQEGEKSPHFRTSYFGLRWTGPNRRVPKIVRIKECLVGFKKISTIPTGYYGKEGE